MISMNFISTIAAEESSAWRRKSSGQEPAITSDRQDAKSSKKVDERASIEEIDTTDHKALTARQANSATRALDGLTMADEKTPLLDEEQNEKGERPTGFDRPSRWKGSAGWVARVVRAVVAALFAPGFYLIGCFYDEKSHFSMVQPLRRLTRFLRHQSTPKSKPVATSASSAERPNEPVADPPRRRSSEGESESRPKLPIRPTLIERRSSRAQTPEEDSPSRHTRSKSVPTSTAETREPALPKRSIRISVLNEDALRQRRLDREKRDSIGSATETQSPTNTLLTAKSIKSPTSPASTLGLTKYPRAPAPPRPLVPKRQPSYTLTSTPAFQGSQKTLILDLDETLIHSMSKGGRMSTGHMVEVKLQNPIGVEGASLGPQVPILYYVHKRPNCDEFLRKVSKWYNLIVFTAAVQEYADPVIDWLELERKYFSARYYRQHCTFRNGAYIKDVSQVEPDLSKVMILDNSPISYTFHEDNAIPIEGWISDPSDNDLLHLIPLLEGLQYSTDVRALLALRLGEATV